MKDKNFRCHTTVNLSINLLFLTERKNYYIKFYFCFFGLVQLNVPKDRLMSVLLQIRDPICTASQQYVPNTK